MLLTIFKVFSSWLLLEGKTWSEAPCNKGHPPRSVPSGCFVFLIPPRPFLVVLDVSNLPNETLTNFTKTKLKSEAFLKTKCLIWERMTSQLSSTGHRERLEEREENRSITHACAPLCPHAFIHSTPCLAWVGHYRRHRNPSRELVTTIAGFTVSQGRQM